MLRIRDILVPGSGSCYLRQLPSRWQLKIISFLHIFWSYSYIFFRDKMSQNGRNQGFFKYFYLMIEGSGSVPRTNRSGSGRPKNIRIQIPTINILSTIKNYKTKSDYRTKQNYWIKVIIGLDYPTNKSLYIFIFLILISIARHRY